MVSRKAYILRGLTDKQREAAENISTDAIVYAGAGSGKTGTLVAHYLYLLDQGMEPESIAAITFTQKAAREMKSRIKSGMQDIANYIPPEGTESAEETEATRAYWMDLYDRMGSAQIGTIHSLCTFILRKNPAEAGVDPRFRVMEEYESTVTFTDLIERVINGLSDSEEFSNLFSVFSEDTVKAYLMEMLRNRSKLRDCPREIVDPTVALRPDLLKILEEYDVPEIIARLSDPASLKEDTAGFIAKIPEILPSLQEAWAQARGGDSFISILMSLRSAFDSKRLNSKKVTAVQTDCYRLWKRLKEEYKDFLSADVLTAEEAVLYQQLIGSLFLIYDAVLYKYQEYLKNTGILDFDGLEERAIAVLSHPTAAEEWHKRFRAILVDEFQDTNPIQQGLLSLLRGENSLLYVVGDEKQSIYRFRRADVSVFLRQAEDIKARGGKAYELDQTFRAHHDLIEAMHPILENVMTVPDLEGFPFYVPYRKLESYRDYGRKGPHIELLGGFGKSPYGLKAAATLLAERLTALKADGTIQDWGDVALLFRASTHFEKYEQALKLAGIPFITVAGKGFYDRPEIRDVLNLLRCAADRDDDNALIGALMSPVMGFDTAMLLELRLFTDAYYSGLPLYMGLMDEAFRLSDPEDAEILRRIRQILTDLWDYAGHMGVDELLERLYEMTDYRSVLAAGGQGRLLRNLDKLTQDARNSGQVIVAEFLRYVEMTEQAGAREGEAAGDHNGAVQLMTIHKSKGLGFPIVVLADARNDSGRSGDLIISEKYGLCVRTDPPALPFIMASAEERLANQAEALRLFYVALTRVKDHLMISGSMERGRMGQVVAGFGSVEGPCGEGKELQIDSSPYTFYYRSLELTPEFDSTDDAGAYEREKDKTELADGEETFLYPSLITEANGTGRNHPSIAREVGLVVGRMVHKCIELNLHGESKELEFVLGREAAASNRLPPETHDYAIQRAKMLIQRFGNSQVFEDIQRAEQVYHELPFTVTTKNNGVNHSVIDLLMKVDGRWVLIDFKTDAIQGQEEFTGAVNRHRRQLHWYLIGLSRFISEPVNGYICFLDADDEVRLVPLT